MKQKTMAAPKVCRVCLVSDRTMYRVANTKLGEIYELLAKAKMQKVGWPITLCCICVTQLHRCRKFAEVAQKANAALDQWCKGRTNKVNLTERPLLSFTETPPEITEFTSDGIQEIEVKQELTTGKTENEDNDSNTFDNNVTFQTEQIKCEFIPCNDPENDNECVSDEENDNTQLSVHNEFDDDCETFIDDSIQQEDDVKTAPSNVKYDKSNSGSDEEYVPKAARRPTKRTKLSGDTKGSPAFKKRRPNKPQHRPVKTYGGSKVKTKSYSCDECNYKSAYKRDFNLHLKKHTDEQPLSCDKCSYTTFHKGHLKEHILTHTREKPISCNECDYRCLTKHDLKRHSLRHTGQKPFQCEHCDFKCGQKYTLKTHLMTHTGERPFACDLCEFKSNLRSKLNIHLKSHTGEEPYLCDKCCYKTSARSDLRRHLMRHAGEKPFSCHLCDYKCLLKHDLGKHLLTHSDVKPFTCTQCDYKSTQKRLLNLHLMKHTGVKPYACEKCDFKCKKKTDLKTHSKIHIGEKINTVIKV